MASRFMKIKRIVIPFITLVIMTSQLAGCATLSSQEMLESAQESPDISIEWATPDTGQQTLDASGAITVGDQQFVTDATNPTDTEDDSDIGLINTDNQEKQPLSGDTLISYFQLAYDSCGAIDSNSLEERINFELNMVQSFCDTDGEKLPVDYADQYRAWRPVDGQIPEVTFTFTEVNETVYATGTVNLRSGPSTDDAKVGQLSKGQSVTRTGIGTGDYSSWSRVKLADGTEVYVASSYLTTTKPSTGNTQQSGANTQNKPQGDSVQQGNNQQVVDSSLSGPDALWQDPYAGMTPEEKAAAIKDAQERQQIIDNETTGIMHD